MGGFICCDTRRVPAKSRRVYAPKGRGGAGCERNKADVVEGLLVRDKAVLAE